ncbi:hypothetical protein MKW98_013920 [Papaver atlanticum]|uniref:Uncharacterized protein n=1 Tax=Papaver atlanticum TaxID=357466 RepID=A0AAD4XE17_9MAGN|nr:hypothetical protein MKW98_013920 [Papaver atlanticum]
MVILFVELVVQRTTRFDKWDVEEKVIGLIFYSLDSFAMEDILADVPPSGLCVNFLVAGNESGEYGERNQKVFHGELERIVVEAQDRVFEEYSEALEGIPV